MKALQMVSDDGTIYHFQQTEEGVEMFSTDSNLVEKPMCPSGLIFEMEDMKQISDFYLSLVQQESNNE